MLKAIKAFFSENVPVMETVEEIIEKIHNEFDTAGEKLLAEAKQILAREDDTSKGDRLKSLGFTKSASAELASTIKLEKAQSRETAERVEYFQQHYPNYKFITEAIVKQICEKYNLVCGDVGYYKGDVPEKNVAEMEVFKLRYEDKAVKYLSVESVARGYMSALGMAQQGYGFFGGLENLMQTRYNSLLRDYSPQYDKALSQNSEQPPERRVQEPFKICAPEKDFDMKYMIRSGKDGYQLIPDPIVLQPVKGGYLVISKWGLEASDELVINQKLN